jgi:hypothetical protein
MTEKDLISLDFEKKLMLGTGYVSINSMRPPIYYYVNGRITVNATRYWTWFLDGDQRNDIAVNSKKELKELLEHYNKQE